MYLLKYSATEELRQKFVRLLVDFVDNSFIKCSIPLPATNNDRLTLMNIRQEEKNMGRFMRNFLMIVSLFSLVFIGSINIDAQPLGFGSPQPQQKSQQKLLSSANGRFVFGQISDSSKDQFMLDTFTGRLWRIAESGAIGIFLRAVPYRNEEGECSMLPEDISDSGLKETKKQ